MGALKLLNELQPIIQLFLIPGVWLLWNLNNRLTRVETQVSFLVKEES